MPTVTGEIIDQDTLTTFLGALNLSILSQQDNTATTPNTAGIQLAIDAAEARVKSRLMQWFAIPLTVAHVAVKSAAGSVALPLLQAPAHEYAGFLLNKWRAIQSLSTAEEPVSNVDKLAAAWEKDADDNLKMILRWAQGYDDGLAVDLDFATGVTRGAYPRTVSAPVFAGATVDKNGLPERKIINPAGLPWWGVVPNPWCFISE